jgi:hypothetical protein
VLRREFWRLGEQVVWVITVGHAGAWSGLSCELRLIDQAQAAGSSVCGVVWCCVVLCGVVLCCVVLCCVGERVGGKADSGGSSAASCTINRVEIM